MENEIKLYTNTDLKNWKIQKTQEEKTINAKNKLPYKIREGSRNMKMIGSPFTLKNSEMSEWEV